ncbi:MAG: hypothetical protein HY000_35270 [Planctomycetes bacterium]|nr:hypothetical protein [Planctomycetota bacterium]
MLPQLLEKRTVSVYQDVVVAGQTISTGRRDCKGRWQAIAPHFPTSGAVLDIGSNFGWFGLRACETSRRLVVASVEADEGSAAIQRHVLESHRHERIVLLTRRAGIAMAREFAAAGQRFEAVLCLSVLHWMPDHEPFLLALGALSRKIFVELPSPDEDGAGVSEIRRQIGEAGDYLQRLFPERRRVRLAQTASHRKASHPREIWLAEQIGHPASHSPGLDVSALLRLSPSWPPQSWWRRQIDRVWLENTPDLGGARLVLSPDGVTWSPAQAGQAQPSLPRIKRQVAGLPETRLFSRRDWIARRIRGIAKSTKLPQLALKLRQVCRFNRRREQRQVRFARAK